MSIRHDTSLSGAELPLQCNDVYRNLNVMEPFFRTTWVRPVNAAVGYRVHSLPLPGAGQDDASGERVPVLVPCDEHGLRRWEPFDEEPALFRIFAETDPTPEGILGFVNRYGPLLGPANFFGSADAQSVGAIRCMILWLRHLLHLWDSIEDNDLKALRQIVQFRNGTIYFQKVLMQAASGHAHYRLDWNPARTRATPGKAWLEATPPFSLSDVRALAMLCLSGELGSELHADCRIVVRPQVRVGVVQEYDRPAFVIAPTSLWGLLVLQFAKAVEGERRYQRCAVCRRWFLLAPGINRADRQTCSGTCRNRLYFQRQQRAREMHAQGKTPREIARELGSDVKKVRAWIKKEG
jgi:hypothetical protein